MPLKIAADTLPPVAIDSEAILRRVVNDVFDAGVDVEFSTQPNYRQMHRALLTSRKNER